MYKKLTKLIKDMYPFDGVVALHRPSFLGNEKRYLNQAIDSTYVSSVGEYVDKFESNIASYTNAKYAVATSCGTSALHSSLIALDINEGDEVLTQSLSFVATSNAISYCRATPVFIDVDKKTLGLDHKKLKSFLEDNTRMKDGKCINIKTGKRVHSCIPVHTFGNPCKIDKIAHICSKYNIHLIEDAAESLGTFYKNRHTGRFGKLGIFSFNGNKVITTGGGGAVVTDDKKLAIKLKHLTTTAKIAHPYEFIHDEVGYNYRLPNINAALGLAQLERLNEILANKKQTYKLYKEFFKNSNFDLVAPISKANSNHWLNTIIAPNKKMKIELLEHLNKNGILARSIWRPLHLLPMYKDFYSKDMKNSMKFYNNGICLPSSERL